MKKFVHALIASLILLPVCFASCSDRQTGTEEESSMTDTEIITETITEAEAPSPYLIADPCRVDFSAFDNELFSAAFSRGNCASPELTEDGALFVANKQSRDPGIYFRVNSMYKAAGYPSSDGENHVPFTPEEKKVIVLKIQAEWGGAFEMFYATGSIKNAREGYSITAVYGGDSEFFGERKTQYLIFEADKKTKGWKTSFNDKFRLDYTNYVEEGDKFLLQAAAFCADRKEAEEYIAADKKEETPKTVEKGYYVCLYEDRLDKPKDNIKGSVYQSLDEAKAACDKQKKYGYRVADENGNVVVLCKGLTNYLYDSEGNYQGSEIVSNSAIYTINKSSLEAKAIKEFDHQLASYGGNLMACNNGTIYFVDDAVYSMTSNGEASKLIEGTDFYGISVDSKSGDIWVVATPYGSTHSAIQYSKDGKLIKKYSVTNQPNAVVFD